jgi:hypothetical protein
LDSYPACRDAHSTPLAVPVPTPTTAAEPRRQARTRTIYTSKGCRPATCAQRRSSRLPLPPVDARTHACCRARTNLAQPACHSPAPPSMRASSLRAPSICHHACLPCSACGCSIALSLSSSPVHGCRALPPVHRHILRRRIFVPGRARTGPVQSSVARVRACTQVLAVPG